MAFQSVINPHNGAYGSTTSLTGIVRIDWQSVALPPTVVIADDSSAAVHGKSSHAAHTGMVTMVDPTSARLLAAQAGPRVFSFDAEESDAAADASYSFAGCEFGQPGESLGVGQPSNLSIPFAALGLTPS